MSVDISHLKVDENNRQQGLCRAFTQNLYRAAQAGGFQKIELTSSFDGRFVWAALGFRPTEQSWEVLKMYLLDRLARMAEHYDIAHVTPIREIVALDSPLSLPLLANLPGRVNDRFSPVGIVCRLLLDGPVWHGELSIGDDIDEQHLFG